MMADTFALQVTQVAGRIQRESGVTGMENVLDNVGQREVIAVFGPLTFDVERIGLEQEGQKRVRVELSQRVDLAWLMIPFSGVVFLAVAFLLGVQVGGEL